MPPWSTPGSSLAWSSSPRASSAWRSSVTSGTRSARATRAASSTTHKSKPPLRLAVLVLAVVSLLERPACTRAELVGAAVVPHGDFAYAPELLPVGSPERAAADKIHAACLDVGRFVGELEPDLVLLSTPHGLELSVDFAAYLNSQGQGFAAIGQDLHNSSRPPTDVPLPEGPINLAPKLAAELVDRMRTDLGQNVSGLKGFADSEPAALRWGEVVPLLLAVPEATRKRSRLLVWSQPLRRYTQSPAMVPELLRVGGILRKWIDGLPERVVVIISSDLAHTHLASGPYGFSNASEPFDRSVGHWAKDPLGNADALLVTARNLEDRAMSCGFTGLVMLHGMLFGSSGRAGRAPGWDSQLLANGHPTYYGMAVVQIANSASSGVAAAPAAPADPAASPRRPAAAGGDAGAASAASAALDSAFCTPLADAAPVCRGRGYKLRVGSYNLSVCNDTAWTFRNLLHGSDKTARDELLSPTGFTQTVSNVNVAPNTAAEIWPPLRPVACPVIPQGPNGPAAPGAPHGSGFLGTGHGGELIYSVSLLVSTSSRLDGDSGGSRGGTYNLLDPSFRGGSWGKGTNENVTLTIVKESQIGPFLASQRVMLDAALGMVVSADYELAYDNTTGLVNWFYSCMSMFSLHYTHWVAKGANGTIIGPVAFAEDNSFSLAADIRWAAVFDEATKQGALYQYPTASGPDYKGFGAFKNSFWNRPRDHKLYLRVGVPTTKGAKFGYKHAVQHFQSPDAGQWIQTAQSLVRRW